MVTKLGNGGMERIERCELELGHSGVRATVGSFVRTQARNLQGMHHSQNGHISKSGRE